MAQTTARTVAPNKNAPDPDDEQAAAAPAGSGRKKVLVIAAALVALVAGWYFLLGPGAGGQEAAAKEPVPGEVIELEPITMNLADGRLLKVGLALQANAEPSGGGHGELTGAIALDEAIKFLGEHTYAQLAEPAGRQAAKDELSHRVAERYHHDVLEVYFTEFVMQ